jgi:hypothetical protein
MQKVMYSVLVCFVGVTVLQADHIPTHGQVTHFDLNPPGGFWNPVESNLVPPPGCQSLQSAFKGLFEGGYPGAACAFADTLNEPPHDWHAEIHLKWFGQTEFKQPFTIEWPFFGPIQISGELTLAPGEDAYFDIHVQDFLTPVPGGGVRPGSDVGPWFFVILPGIKLPNGDIAVPPLGYDGSITEDITGTPMGNVYPPGFRPGEFGQGVTISLVRTPEPHTAASAGLGVISLILFCVFRNRTGLQRNVLSR